MMGPDIPLDLYDEDDYAAGYAAAFGGAFSGWQVQQQTVIDGFHQEYPGTPVVNGKSVYRDKNQPRHRAITVTRPPLLTWRYWPSVLGFYRALRHAGVERDKARREMAVEVEVLAWALEKKDAADRKKQLAAGTRST